MSFEGGKFYFEGLKSGRVRILTRGAALRRRSVSVVNLESALPDAMAHPLLYVVVAAVCTAPAR